MIRTVCAGVVLIIAALGAAGATYALETSAVEPASMTASTDCVTGTFEGASGGSDFYPLAHQVTVEPVAGGGCVLTTTTRYAMRDQRIVRLPVGLR